LNRVLLVFQLAKKQERGNPGTRENPMADGSFLENSYSNNADLKFMTSEAERSVFVLWMPHVFDHPLMRKQRFA